MELLRKLFKRKQAAQIPQRVAIRSGSVVTEVGASAILHALFSSISANLEPAGWGSRFPLVMNSLYQGRLVASDCAAAIDELHAIESELRELPVSVLVWDIEDRAAPPSPHYHAGAQAANLAEYFITVNGLGLLRQGLIESVESAAEFGDDVQIFTFSNAQDLFARNA